MCEGYLPEYRRPAAVDLPVALKVGNFGLLEEHPSNYGIIARFMPKHIALVITGLVIALFLVYNYYFSVDFPFQDDLVLVNFVNEVSNGVTTSTFLQNLFRTDNDHKVVIPRLIALFNYLLTGHLNFKAFIGLVSLNLLYILYFLFLQFRKLNLPLYYFLPVPFLYLQPQHYEVSLWAINGMQHSFLTVFLVTAILLVSKPSKLAYFGAIACCFLATFTHGNGILSFPALIFYFLCYQNFRKAIGVGIFMLVALGMYLGGYESGQAAHLPPGVGVVLGNFLGFIGATMMVWSPKLIFSVLWGGLILLFAGFLVYKIALTYVGREKKVDSRINVELLTLFCFIVSTSLVIAVFRSWMGSTLASRFEVYAALSSCILYLVLLGYFPVFKRKYVVLVLTALSALTWGQSYYEYTGTVAKRKTTYVADIYNWTNNRNLLSVDISLQQNAAFYLFPAFQKGILEFPPPIISKRTIDSLLASGRGREISLPLFFEKQPMNNPASEIDTLDFLRNDTFARASARLNQRFLVLRAHESRDTYLVEANPKIQARRLIITRAEFHKAGFVAYLRKNNFPDDRYDMGLLDISEHGERHFQLFTNVLVVKGRKLSLNN